MVATKNRVIEKAYTELKRLSQDEKTRMIFEARQKAIMDEFSRIKSAEEKGLQKGLEKGLQEGLEKGLQEGLEKGLQKGLKKGLQEGLEKGKQEGMQQAAKQMLENGLDIDVIMKCTGLSIEEIKNALY